MHFLCAQSSSEKCVVSVPAGSVWLSVHVAQSNLINFSSHQELLGTCISSLTWTIPAVLILMKNVTRKDKFFPSKAGGEQIHPLKSLWGCTRRLFLLCGPPYSQHSVESVKLIQHLCYFTLTQTNWEWLHGNIAVATLKLRGLLFLGLHTALCPQWEKLLACTVIPNRMPTCLVAEGFCCLPEAGAAWGGTFHCTPSPPPPCAEKEEEEEDNNNEKKQEKEKQRKGRRNGRGREGGPLHTTFLKCRWVGFNWIAQK